MQNKSSSKIIQFIPLLGILFIFCLQHYYAYQMSQSNERLANEQIENLRAAMQADNTPPEIKEHILSVAQNSTFQIQQTVRPENIMTVFFQINILLMVYSFYSMQSRKTNQAEERGEL